MILLIIDTQKGITNDELYKFEEFERNVSALIDESRKHGVEVAYVQHDDGKGSGFTHGDEDFEIYDGFAPLENEKIFYKSVNSAFNPATGLTRYLQSKDIKDVIAVGLQTDYCIDATIKSGFEQGFKMIVPALCNTTRDNPYMSAETAYKFYNEYMWPKRYATCVSFDEALKLIRDYKAPEVTKELQS